MAKPCDDDRIEALSFRISSGLKAALQELADIDRRLLSQYVRLALEAHVEAKRKEGGKKR